MASLSLEERFWTKVIKGESPDDCWGWTDAPNKLGGYGRIQVDGKHIRAHRISWEIHNGPIPDGLDVLHDCDNPLCSNYRHLFLGTHTDNMRDKVRKGRANLPVGDKHHNSKLTQAIVTQIKEKLANGISQSVLALHFGIHQTTISQIATGKTWGHVIVEKVFAS
jgi:predicted XRE-type DNA-binding protein